MMNSAEDSYAMRKDIMDRIRRLMPFDMSSFYLKANDGSHVLADPVGIGFPDGALEEYIDKHENDAPLVWTNEYPKNIIIRDTDIIPKGEIRDEWYYDELKTKFDIDYILTLSMAHNGENVGLLTLFRKSDKTDFSEREMYIAKQIIDHVSQRLYYYCYSENNNRSTKINRSLKEIAFVHNLSNKEADVFILLCRGKHLDEISAELYIADSTLKKHIGNIYKKLNIKNRYELMGIILPEFIDEKQ
jgi:DNA-binding CsgD family transcriptional regulator